MAAPQSEYRAVVVEGRKRLDRLIDQRGAAALLKLYQDSAAELERKLASVAGSGTMGEHQKRVLLAQAKIGIAQIQRKLGTALGAASYDTQVDALRGLIGDIKKLESKFTGAAMVLPIEQAAQFDGIINKNRTSLLNAHKTSMDRYGALVVRRVEQELAKSIATGETPQEAAQRVADTVGGEWWRAERIARTELAWAFNATRAAGVVETAKVLPDMMMRWSEHVDDNTYAPLDARVAVDSVAMHGQLAAPGEKFVMPPSAPVAVDGEALVPEGLVGQSWEHPPNRPNDRAVLAPWRPGWGVPGWTWEGGKRTPFKGSPQPARPVPEVGEAKEKPKAEAAPAPVTPPAKPRIDPTRVTATDVEPARIKDEDLPRHGVAVPADAESIENQNVQARLLRDEHGEFYEFNLKLTPAMEEQARKALASGSASEWEYQQMKPDADGVLRIVPGGEKQPGGSSIKGDITDPQGQRRGSVELGTSGANRNAVRIRVRSSDPKEAVEAYSHMLRTMGVTDPNAKPDKAHADMLMQMKVAAKFEPGLVAKAAAGGITPAKAAQLAAQVGEKHPLAKKMLADTERREVYFGHEAGYSESQAKAFKDSGVLAFTHDSSADPSALASVLTEDGLMATTRRFENGVFTEGMSSREDLRTGGADGVFLRMTRKRKMLDDSDGEFRLLIDPAEAGRTDWWAFNEDNFGRAGPEHAGGRWKLGEMLKPHGHVSDNNEVIFQKGVKPGSIMGVVAMSSTKRDKLLNALRAKGVTEINGKKIEDFITVLGEKARRSAAAEEAEDEEDDD